MTGGGHGVRTGGTGQVCSHSEEEEGIWRIIGGLL